MTSDTLPTTPLGDAMTTDIETRIRRLEDRQALSDLVATYGRVVDDRDLDALRALWTDDAVFESTVGPVSGRDEVVDHYVERMRMFEASFHIPHSQTVEFASDDEAHGIVTAHAELGMPDGAFWVALRYHDRYRRTAEGWRFVERRVRQLYAMPLVQLADGLSEGLRKRWPNTPRAEAELPESLDTWASWTAGSSS